MKPVGRMGHHGGPVAVLDEGIAQPWQHLPGAPAQELRRFGADQVGACRVDERDLAVEVQCTAAQGHPFGEVEGGRRPRRVPLPPDRCGDEARRTLGRPLLMRPPRPSSQPAADADPPGRAKVSIASCSCSPSSGGCQTGHSRTMPPRTSSSPSASGAAARRNSYGSTSPSRGYRRATSSWPPPSQTSRRSRTASDTGMASSREIRAHGAAMGGGAPATSPSRRIRSPNPSRYTRPTEAPVSSTRSAKSPSSRSRPWPAVQSVLPVCRTVAHLDLG